MSATNRNHRCVFAASVIAILTLSMLAAPRAAWSNLHEEIRQFHDFLANHPKVSTEIRANPNLVNSKKYLDKHDDLKKFLKRHPAVKREIVEHPRRVFGNYHDRANARHHRWHDR